MFRLNRRLSTSMPASSHRRAEHRRSHPWAGRITRITLLGLIALALAALWLGPRISRVWAGTTTDVSGQMYITITSGPTPNPAACNTRIATALSASTGVQPEDKNEAICRDGTWTWWIHCVYARSSRQGSWVAVPGSYTDGGRKFIASANDKTVVTLSANHANGKLDAVFQDPAYWRVEIMASVDYTDSQGDRWYGTAGPLPVDMTVVKVDLVMQNLGEETGATPHELNPGAVLSVNKDDDNNNGVPDKNDHAAVTGENDLSAVTLSITPNDMDQGILSLRATKGDRRIKFWTEPTKGATPLSESNRRWTPGSSSNIPTTLYVEGVEASEYAAGADTSKPARDVELTLAYEDNGCRVEDKVLVTVYGINLVVNDLPEEAQATPHELDPGAFIALNDDFTENNKNGQGVLIPDYEPDAAAGHRITSSDKKLSSGKIILQGPGVKGRWTITYPEAESGKGNLIVWDMSTSTPTRRASGYQSEEVTLPQTIPLKIEGTRVSSALRDVPIELVFTPSAGYESYAATDQVAATVVAMNLDIDSDNNNGTGAPDRSTAERQIKGQAPGKIVFVNHNDDDNDQVPDYADLDIPGEQNFVPVVLTAQIPLDWQAEGSQVKITFQYAGEAALPAMTGRSLGNNFQDYTANQKGSLRLWNVATPGASRSAGNYLIPGRAYTATELGFTGSKTFYLEGINDAENSDLTATVTYQDQPLTDQVRMTVVGPKLYLNCNNNLNNNDGLRTGVPDVEFTLDENDRIIKDQGKGFCFWNMPGGVSGYNNQLHGIRLDMNNLENAFPIRVYIPNYNIPGCYYYLHCRSISTDKDRCNVDNLGAVIFNYASNSSDNRGYLFDNTIASGQCGDTTYIYYHPLPYTSERYLMALDNKKAVPNKFLFENFEDTQVVSIVLCRETSTGRQIIQEVDSFRITIKSVESYWSLMSSRGDANISFVYPTEDGRTVDILRYPEPTSAPNRNSSKSHYFVYIHGYNVTLDEAVKSSNTIYKRLYWLGFRGNFIGFTWHGEEGRYESIDLSPFDRNVENAFQTSPSLHLALDRIKGWAGNADKVDVMAHSLGNLVMWDAMRLHKRICNGKLVHNAISVEAAVWSGCFEPEQAINYHNPPNDSSTRVTYLPSSDVIPPNNNDPGLSYTVNDLKEHSWAFWFRQSGHEATDALSGKIYNSYVTDDYALEAMRKNDYGTYAPVGGNRFSWHYFPDQPPFIHTYRGPNTLPMRVPALIRPQSRIISDYAEVKVLERAPIFFGAWVKTSNGWMTLQLPLGQTNSPVAGSVNFDVKAKNVGWRNTKHADYADQDYPTIYPWYDQFLKPAITIGSE